MLMQLTFCMLIINTIKLQRSYVNGIADLILSFLWLAIFFRRGVEQPFARTVKR